MSNILVTGVNGFVGRHLAKELHDQGYGVLGLGQEKNTPKELKNYLSGYFACDLNDYAQVSDLPFDSVSAIVNLAGLANVAESFKLPGQYEKVNVNIISNLASAVAKKKHPVRLVAVSTGAVYDPNQNMPLTEMSSLVRLDNTSPYVKSKIKMEEVAEESRRNGVDCVIVRPFNHIGPGQNPGFLVPDLAKQVQETVSSGTNQIQVGDLSTRRDYTDVRDVVRAYRLLATVDGGSLNHSIYNVCSGTPCSGAKILELVSKELGIPKLEVTVDKSRIRPNDPPELYGSYEKLKADTGWEPTIPLDQTIADFVSWRKSSPAE